MILPRRGLLLGAAALALSPRPSRAQSDTLTLSGPMVQGGHVLGRTWPHASILVDGAPLATASASGVFIVGFDRDAPAGVRIESRLEGRSAARTLAIVPGVFSETRIDGLPPSTVEPADPALLDRIRREAALKAGAFASCMDADHFRDGFVWPLETVVVSSPWGSQRILNGTPARPHYGVDLAAPQGSSIRAPAAGRVALAEPDLHFEGGLVLIDHGQGLISAFLHQSRLDVRAGQNVARGDIIGRVGMTGRATGPHLCWRMKWRDRNLDPSLMVQAPQQ